MTLEKKNNLTILTANEGYIFIRKGDREPLSEQLYLGVNDSADNYEEIPESEIHITDNSKEDMI